MVGFSYGELREEYADLWGAMKIPAGTASALDARIRAIARGRPRYDQVANATGVPWYVIAIIHEMEASLKFTTHLHNGDPLTDRTVQVPAGRPPEGMPPFEWEDSAIDALMLKNLNQVKLWSIERIAYQLEAYNGWGYRTRATGINTPYLWSSTTNYRKGKFVRDRVFDPNAVSRQLGAMALLRRLIETQGVNVPSEADVPLPAAQPPTRDAELARQPYPGVVVRLNHADPAVVMLLQRRLNQLGCWAAVDAQGKAAPVAVDGDFGQQTLAAVKLFQARTFDADGKALAVDGVIGRGTWAALFPTLRKRCRFHRRRRPRSFCARWWKWLRPKRPIISGSSRPAPTVVPAWTSICAPPASTRARAIMPGALLLWSGASKEPRGPWEAHRLCPGRPGCMTCGRRPAGLDCAGSPTTSRRAIRALCSRAMSSSSNGRRPRPRRSGRWPIGERLCHH